MTEDPSPKKPRSLDLNELAPAPVKVSTTGAGDVYVRTLAIGRLSEIEKAVGDTDDMRTIGDAVIAASTSRGPEREASSLTPEEVTCLTIEDRAMLANAVAKANRWTLEGNDPVSALGVVYRKEVDKLTKSFADSFSKTKKELSDSLAKLKGTFSTPTLELLTEQATLSSRMSDALKTPSWVDAFKKEMETRDLLAKSFGSHNFEGVLPATSVSSIGDMSTARFPDIPHFDIEKSPMGRAARASEETARNVQVLLELNRSTLLQMSQIGTLVSKTSAEYLAKVAEDREYALHSQRLTSRSLVVAAIALVVSACLSVWTINQTYRYKLENDEQQSQLEMLIKRQAEATEQLLNLSAKQHPTPESTNNISPKPGNGNSRQR